MDVGNSLNPAIDIGSHGPGRHDPGWPHEKRMVLDLPKFKQVYTFGIFWAFGHKCLQKAANAANRSNWTNRSETRLNNMKSQEWSWLDVSGHARWEFCMWTWCWQTKWICWTKGNRHYWICWFRIWQTTKVLKEGFAATLSTSFAGWDTQDFYRRWNKLDFCWICLNK